MDTDTPTPDMPTYQELVEQNKVLHEQLERMSANEMYIWSTILETSRKLQSSSASIKAAVSSLLSYDIFWDGANQHEFLMTINASIDQVSDLVRLIDIESRLSSGALEFRREPHLLQEILTIVRVRLSQKEPNINLTIEFPEDGKLIDVDYAYLILALELFIQVIALRSQNSQIKIRAQQIGSQWKINFEDIDTPLIDMIEKMVCCNFQPNGFSVMSAENILKLHVAVEIISLQEFGFEFPQDHAGLTLVINGTGQ